MEQHLPSLQLTSITVAAPAPRALAQFYAALLGAEITALDPARPGEPEQAGWAQVKTANLTLNFEFERHWRTPCWPAEADRPTATQHVDIQVDDLASAVEWAIACGARTAEFQPQTDVRAMLDPAGHPFCLFR
jgi:catechol 2,3-dioxygenase-like lactoylglutathione lyase family enzyme